MSTDHLIWPIGPLAFFVIYAIVVAYYRLSVVPHYERKMRGRVNGAVLGWYARAVIANDRSRRAKVAQ